MSINRDEPAVVVQNVSKTFRIPIESSSGLKQKLINILKGRKGYRDFTPLNDISFTINKGEFFGIVGRNGSGKSTLLKTLAGIYTPDKGAVHVDGKLVPFIELGVGFNPELTGRENVFLNGALLGFSRKEMESMYHEIVDFAELHDFMEERLKNYSSGMQVRLAFSIAIRAQGDVLLLDEVLAVGDAAFQQKCFEYFASLKSKEKTVILVSHSMSAIERYCHNALLLEDGKIVKYGKSSDIATLYEKLFLDDSNKNIIDDKEEQQEENEKKPSQFSVKARIQQNDKSVRGVTALERFTVSLNIQGRVPVDRLNVGINIRNTEGVIVFSQDMRKLYKEVKAEKDISYVVDFEIENFYTNGTYFVDVVLVDEGDAVMNKLLYSQNDVCTFKIFGIRDHIHSLVHPPVVVKVKKGDEK